MLVGSPRCKLRQWLAALFFLLQYHCRASFLALYYKVRSISRTDIDVRVRDCWDRFCQAAEKKRLKSEQFIAVVQVVRKILKSEQFTAVARAVKRILENERFTMVMQMVEKKLESERLHTTLRRAKARLERMVFTEEEEETPAQLLDPASLGKLKAAWHTFETTKIPKMPRLAPETLKLARQAFETAKISKVSCLVPGTLGTAWPPLKAPRTPQQQRVTLIALGFAALALITLFAASGLGHRALSTVKTINFSTAPQASFINASKALVRISQLDPSEYASQDEYNIWAYSACSTASMTEVFDAYGRHYRITDVLKVESALGEVTPQLGLLNNVGVAETAEKFGFQTTWGNNWTLNQVLENANAGRPVIVGWPPSLYADGHIVVVTGGDANNIYLADSSLWNRSVISVAQFMQWWGGFAAVVTPA